MLPTTDKDMDSKLICQWGSLSDLGYCYQKSSRSAAFSPTVCLADVDFV